MELGFLGVRELGFWVYEITTFGFRVRVGVVLTVLAGNSKARCQLCCACYYAEY